MKLPQLSIHAAHELLSKKEITAVELTTAVLSRIEEIDPQVRAFLTVCADDALAQAAKADAAIAAGEMTPLTGIPLAIKDVMCTRGIRTTCASKMLENFIPPYAATVVAKLEQAGAVMVGKANMDEFAMGSTTENSGFHPTYNPWNLAHVPGGSSGGSAAAVAADMCLGALGSDTGGSIRQPASHCSVVGLKPTYGRVSRYGLVAFASSLDQIGPLAKDAEDCAWLLNAIAGHDPKDSTSVPEPVPDFTQALDRGVAGLKIGLPVEYHGAEGLHPDVKAAVNEAISQLEAMGASCVEVSLPHTDYAVAAYYVIAPSEASSNLARYDAVKYGLRAEGDLPLLEMYRKTRSQGFGPEVQRRIILGTYSLSAGYYDAYYGKASQVRTLIVEDFRKAFETCDVIASPVAPTPAMRIGETAEDPLTMYLSDIFTLSANLAGIPGISIPCGFSATGLPIGLQVLGSHFSEMKLLQVAGALQSATNFHQRKPAFAETGSG